MRTPAISSPKQLNPQRFFALALGLSWLFWLPLALSGRDALLFPQILLFAAGGVGPAAAEIFLIARNHNKLEWRNYWQRVFDFRRISTGWYLVILFTPPFLTCGAIVLSFLLAGEQPDFTAARQLLARPWAIIPFALFILLFGPLPEELGWRGYGLDSLQTRWNALASSFLLGAMWALWHLPLFFMVGTFQHDEIGFGTPGFWSFCFGTVLSSILFTWIYNNNHRSTLSAILFHFSLNFSGEFLTPGKQARLFQLLLLAIMATAVTLIWGAKTLTHPRKSKILSK